MFNAALLSLCNTKCHQFIGEIYVPRGPSSSFAAVWLLWTAVSQCFIIHWNVDESYRWSVKESIMSGFNRTDFGEGHVEQSQIWKMTGNSTMTSAMSQCKARLMKWRSQWASITPYKTWSPPRDCSCELRKEHISCNRRRNWSRVGIHSRSTSPPNMVWLIWQ